MSDSSRRSLASTTTIASGVIVGFTHLAVAVLLWNHWFDNLWELTATKPLSGLYLLLGMFSLGFVPTVLYVGRKVVSPAIIVGGSLVIGGAGSALLSAVTAPSAAPTPFALYAFLWAGILLIGIMAGRSEFSRNQQADT